MRVKKICLQNKNKKKICIVVSSLGSGGAERSSALLSIMLHNLGHDVHIISILNNIEYEYKGQLFNLGEFKDRDDSTLGRLKRFFMFRTYIRKHDFDLIVDNRARTPVIREFLISTFIYDLSKTIFVVRSYMISKYFPEYKLIAKYLYCRASKVVGVSKEISEEVKRVYGLKNTTHIYNPVPLFKEAIEQIEGEYILALGRLKDKVKNFSLLIDAYAMSKLKENGVKLIILGDGEDKVYLKEKVEQLGLKQDILFYSFVSNPYSYIKQAKYVCLTSYFEGFPRVLVESLSLGVPVVSVNCKSGPKEIIIHEENGLLVEEYEKDAFANAMNSFIFDETLYDKCRSNAKNSVEHLSIDNIAMEWQRLINTI